MAIIHIGINDIANNKKNYLYADHMLQNMKSIAKKCKRHGIQEVLITGLLTTNRLAQDFIEKLINQQLKICVI